jgi:hypothetical protein
LLLSGCNIGTAGAATLAGSRLFSGVKVCDLSANDIGPKGTAALAESRHAASLRHLDLSSGAFPIAHPLGTTTHLSFARSPHLRNLTRLDLSGCAGRRTYTSGELAAFLSSLEMPSLRYLSLRHLLIGTSGVKAIAASPSFRRLTTLDLSNGGITGSGFKVVMESPNLQGLIRLDMVGNRLGESVAALTDRSIWPLMAKCELYWCNIPRAVAKRVVAARRGILADTE